MRQPPRERAYRRAALQVMEGGLPAEALPTELRHRLVRELHTNGLTDREIAEITAMTSYTASRIREELGLEPNRR